MKKNYRIVLLIVMFSFFPVFLISQKESEEALKVNISAYIDAYITTDNDNMEGGDFSEMETGTLTYINPQKDQFRLNIAQISGKLAYKDWARGVVTLQAGDLVQSAWTNLHAQNPMLQQANVGFRLFGNIWLDAGYFLTHIGGELLLPKDNWLSTHSIVTYYEPFYQSGMKLSYETSKLTASLHILNGNGIIEDNNYNKTIGIFIGWTPNDFFSVSYAGVYGNEEPGDPSNAKLHMLNNFCAQVNPMEHFSVKAQVDVANKDVPEIDSNGTVKSGMFLGASVQAKYEFIEKFGAAARLAYVMNEDGVYSPAWNGMEAALGVEYNPVKSSYIRLEGRVINTDDKHKLFYDKDGEAANMRMEVSLNFGFWLD
ncbi:MAG: hypothetical protein QG635_1899 [Bacteroidota bacterium]|nr:hypothetical protein [Bacteroidota bacterium]